MINSELAACTPGAPRARAVGRNHSLWSLLVKDMAMAENRLPDGVKSQLTNLGLWAMRYSTLALLRDLPLEPLIVVNQNVLDGLMEQAGAAQAECAPAAPFSA